EVVRDVPGGDVALEGRVVAVRYREVRDGAGEDAGVEHGRVRVDQLRPGVADEEGKAVREPLLGLHLERVVARVADVVAIEADGVEAGIGPEGLGPRDGGGADRGRRRNDAEARIGNTLE